nr:RecName: Full=Kunitz-type serine protease inhibitor C10; AltName: Full=BPTI-10; AltName: Full=Trypsin inhibitor 10; AltName: Full=Trypsin inhibitor C10 [Daboia siamensis]
YNPASNQCQGF